MAISSLPKLVLDYDEKGDVLYASLGPPQPAVTEEVEDDIWLRYCPPSPHIVGITLLNFRRHFPTEDTADVIQRLLKQYPVVPWAVDE